MKTSRDRRGGPDAALSVWVVQQQEATEETLAFQSLLFLRHPDIQSDVWATPPGRSTPRSPTNWDTPFKTNTPAFSPNKPATGCTKRTTRPPSLAA